MITKKSLGIRQIVIWIRVSTLEQKGTLKAQLEFVKKALKAYGFTDAEIARAKVFGGQFSGTIISDEWNACVAYCLEQTVPTALFTRDFQRLSRNWRLGGAMMIPLFDANVPIISVLKNQVSSTADTIQDNDWLIGLLMAVGAQEVDQLKKRTAAGVQAARKEGILPGTTLDFYIQDELNPYRELKRLLKAGVRQTDASRRLNKSTSWFRKRRDFFSLLSERGGDELVEQWLTATDMIRGRLATLGKGKEDGLRKKAMLRMTSGFMKEPYNFDPFTEEDLDEYLTNYKKYRPKRSK